MQRILTVLFVLACVACARAPRAPAAAGPRTLAHPAATPDTVAQFRVTYDRGRTTIEQLSGDDRVAQFIQGASAFDAALQDTPDADADVPSGTTYVLHAEGTAALDTACNSAPFGDPGVPTLTHGVCQPWALYNPIYGLESTRTYVEVTSLTNLNDSGVITLYNTSPDDSELTVSSSYGSYGYSALQVPGGAYDHRTVNWYFKTPEAGASASFTYTVDVRAVPLQPTTWVSQGDTAGGSMGPYCPPDPAYSIAVSQANVNYGGGGTDPIHIVYVSSDTHCFGASTSHPQVVMITGATTPVLISHAASGGTTGSNGANTNPVMSTDGSCVAWESTATDLISGTDGIGVADSNGASRDIYVRCQTGSMSEETLIASADLGAMDTPASGDAQRPSITPDGTFVAFDTNAHTPCTDPNTGDFVSCDSNSRRDVYVRDLFNAVVWIASPDSLSRNGDAIRPSLATYGTHGGDNFYVAFESDDSTLVGSDSNGATDVFVADLLQGSIQRESVRSGGGQASCLSDQPSIDTNGTYLAFRSCDTGMVGSTTTTGRYHVYHKTIGSAGTLFRADGYVVSSSEADGSSGTPHVEQGGRLVLFTSAAHNLVQYPMSYAPSSQLNLFETDVRAADPARQRTWIISQSAAQYDCLTAVVQPTISASGTYAAFVSGASSSSGMPLPSMGVAYGSYSIWLAPLR